MDASSFKVGTEDDLTDDDVDADGGVDADGDVDGNLCDGELRGVLDKQKNDH